MDPATRNRSFVSLRSIANRRKARGIGRAPALRRLALESLEVRHLLAVHWAVDQDGFWDVPTNWRDDAGVSRLPGVDDEVFLDRPTGTFVVTHRQGQDQVYALHSVRNTFAMTGGELYIFPYLVNVASELHGDLNFSGGILEGSLTVSGTTRWSGGAMRKSPGGHGGVTLTNTGVMNLNGTAGDAAGIIYNYGTINDSTGFSPLTVSLENAIGGIYNVQGDVSPPSLFTNRGTLRKSSGTGVAAIPYFTNLGGSIDVLAGALSVDGRGYSTNGPVPGREWTGGNFNVSAGAFLDLVGADNAAGYGLTGNYAGSGAGAVRYRGDVLKAGAVGASFAFSAGPFEIQSAVIDAGAVGLSNLGKMALTGAGQKFLSGMLANSGTIAHLGPGGLTGGTINNLAGGLYDLQGDIALTTPIINAGELRKSAGVGSIALRPFRNLGGTVDVRSGTLSIDGTTGDGIAPAWTGGRFNASAGATLNWIGANAFQRYDIVGAFSGAGAGRVNFTPAIQTVGAGGVTFDFAPGLFHWTSEQNSRFDGNLVTNLGEIVLDGAGLKYVTGPFNNAGTIIHQGTAEFSVEFGSTFTNLAGAVFEFRGDRSLLGAGEFINRGVVRKSSGAGLTVLANAFANDGGSIEVQVGTISIGQAFSGGSLKVVRNASLLVSAGAALELSASGITTTYEGAISGSGAGAIRFSDGRVLAGPAGATFNFPATMFQWTGGILDGGSAGLNNTGVITLAGANPKQLQGVVNNAGTIFHGGTANLAFFGCQLNNLPGAIYDFQGDVSLVRTFSDNTLVRNQGTFRKSAGTSASLTGVPFVNLGGTIDVRAASFVMKAAGEAILHTGGTFLVSAGALLDLTGGDRFDTPRFKGEFHATGAGRILLFAGNVTIDPAGASFDFAPGMFQWMGGLIDARQGTFTNRGSITLPEGNLQPVLAGVLRNAGAISFINDAQLLFRGDLGLGEFNNLPSGVIEFQGDGGLIRMFDGFGPGATLLNQGTLRRNGGAGTTRLTNDVFSNFGTVEVLGGTLRVESTTLPQFSGATLLAGAWRAAAGGVIDVTNAPFIAVNRGKVLLDGPGSGFPKIDTIASNEGEFQLLGGRDFATVGALTNAGQITLGPASTLVVAAAYTQTADGKLISQIAGPPESGLLGHLSSIAPANLGGAFEVALSNGFGPAAGQSSQVLTFPSKSSDFGAYRGLSVGKFALFGAQLNATELRLNALLNTADLAFQEFIAASIPASAMLGQNLSVSFRARNQSNLPAVGDWVDSVYLSRDAVLDASDQLLGRVEHTGGLSPNAEYTSTVAAPLPPLVPGAYRVLVLLDSRSLSSDAERTNNFGVASQSLQIDVPALTLGVPLAGNLQPGQELYFRVLAPPGEDLTTAVDFMALPGALVSLRRGALPDDASFDDQAPSDSLRPRLLLANAQGGEYYLRLSGRADAAAAIPFTLTVSASTFEITRVSPLRGSNLAASAIIELRGAQFTSSTTVRLRDASGATRNAEAVKFVNTNRLVATVSLTGLTPGAYQIEALDGAIVAVAFDSFEVTEKPPGETGAFIWLKTIATVEFKGTISRTFRNQRIAFGEYNTSDSPLPAPLYLLRATNVQPGQEVQGSLGSDTVPPRTLPGNYFEDDAQIYTYKPKEVGDHVKSTYDLYQIEPSSTSMEWDSRKASLRPATIAPDAWDAIWENLRPRLGETLSDFWLLLTDDSEKLAAIGDRVQSIDRLFSFELQKANNMPAIPVPASSTDVVFPSPGLPLVFTRSFGGAISERYRLGRLGRGWTDNFDVQVFEDAASGLTTVSVGGKKRLFQRLEDGTYGGLSGESAALTKQAGAFRLREASGEVIAFRPDGLFLSIADTNGNQITASYSGTQLATLTHTSGAQLKFDYLGERLHEVTDPSGAVTTYEYDATGQHLIRAMTSGGRIEYTYTPDADGPRAHALATIAFPTGTHLYFDYDSLGRLVRQRGDDSATGTVRYAYDLTSFQVVNAQDQSARYFYDDALRIRKSVDALGRVSEVRYDEDNLPVAVTSADGGAVTLEYDSAGNLTSVQNPLGATQEFAYGDDFAELQQWRDALGNETQFEHDARGNLIATIQADGTRERAEFDASGNLLKSIDRRGQAIQFVYNERGQVTSKVWPDGAKVDYTFNERGNPDTITNAAGVTRLEYTVPGSPDLLTKVTYPNGRFVSYEYDHGRRARIVDSSGFAVRYAYDVDGRLDVLRDAADQLIVDYDYDSVGRLKQETRANGTRTEYAYDQAGQVLSIVHRAPDGTVQGQFVYEYDSLGRRASMTTLEGVTTYGYDAAGRLTSATLPNLRTLEYAYDAAGNRLRARDGFATTNYEVNALNEYTSIGAKSQTFDAAGNLLATVSAAGNESYQYDVEGRLVEVITPGGTWHYEYDVFGNRAATVHNGVRTEFLVDPMGAGDVLAEFDGAGQVQTHYTHGRGLTSRVDAAGQAAFYQFDALGSTSLLTGASGGVLNAYRYLPFGEALSANEQVPNSFEFVGQYGVSRDGAGLDYMRNRWYSATQGRFTQADPIGLAGGTNLYAYADNDPLSAVDPTGHNPYPVGETYEAFEAALAWWKAYDAARIAAQAASPPPGTYPPGVTPPTPQVWNPTVPADPLARTTYVNPPNYSQFAAQVERAAAEQAAKAAREAAARSAARGALYAILGIELFSLAHSLWALETFVTTGNDVGCVPGVPAEVQVCNPRVDFLTGKHIQSLDVTQENPAEDPNDIVGPVGYGPAGHLRPEAPLSYVVNFENKSDALGPAAEVFVTLTLDDDLDLDTFQLDEAGFGDVVIQVPVGRQSYRTRLDLTATRGVFVDVDFQLNRATRTVTWTLQSIDPETLDLPGDPALGFLPPNKSAAEGMGFVSYSVRSKQGVTSGTRIEAQASIVFDTNPAILTNVAVNTIDDGRPTSRVLPLPAQSPQKSLELRWEQSDEPGGAGVASVDIYVAVDGGPPQLLLNGVSGDSTVIPLEVNHEYAFYTIARDGVGHEELPPIAPDAIVRIVPGDVNNDGRIDLDDLNGIRNNFGLRGENLLGDTDFDGDVDLDDLNNVREYFGLAVGPAPFTTEPFAGSANLPFDIEPRSLPGDRASARTLVQRDATDAVLATWEDAAFEHRTKSLRRRKPGTTLT